MIISYLLFIGSAMYLVSGIMFLYLFLRTLRTKDGIGLVFLKFLTFSLSISSFVVFSIRVLSEYGTLDLMTARAIALVNPVLMVAVALYLNYLFHQKIISSSTNTKVTVTTKTEKNTEVEKK